MRFPAFLAAASAAVSITAAGLAQAPEGGYAFSPSDLDARAVAAPLQVAVLGTPHLRGAPDAFERAMLEPLLDRLETFEPTHIAVETVSGEHLRFLMAEAARHEEAAEQFGSDVIALMEAAGETVELTPSEALAEAEALIEEPLGPEDRRTAAALMARAGEAPSAAALWLQIPGTARMAGGPVSDDLAAELDRVASQDDESYAIGAVLAARLGLDRVYAMDDWTQSDAFMALIPRLQPLIAGDEPDPVLGQVMQSDVLAPMREMPRRLTSREGVMEVYRAFNDASEQPARADAEWGAFLAAPSDPDAARARVAIWEARNLHMAARIAEAAAGEPGGRMLVIVGASHKPYLDAMLGSLSAVELVDTQALLGE